MKRIPLVLISVISVFLLSACLLTNPKAVISCSSYAFTADDSDSIVDNTGTGQQRTILEIYDGLGTLLFRDFNTTAVPSSSGTINIADDYDRLPKYNPIRLVIYSPAGGALASRRVWFSATGECPGLPTLAQPAFFDGRINDWDSAAPFAIYHSGDDLHFYWIDEGEGTLALTVTQAEMEAIQNPTGNTLIASNEALGLEVYRLSDGQIQAQAHMANGKLYVIIISDVPAGAHVSFELE